MYILTTIIFLLIMVTQSYSNTILKDDFQNPEKWSFVSDKVMGGVSSGKVFFNSKDDKNYAFISGKVSTKNSGGFIQIRRKLNNINLSKSKFIKVIAKGNNQKYFVHIRTTGTFFPWQYYQLDFNVEEDYKLIKLPIREFKRSGSFLSKTINPQNITSIGLVAFGRDHLAELYIQEIEFIE